VKPSYLAGLIDGEGCVSLDAEGRPVLTITNTFRPLMDALRAKFKGVVHTMLSSHAKAHKTAYTWRVRGAAAVEILRKCARYMIVKAEQAWWVLQAQALRTAYKRAGSRARQQELVKASALVLQQVRWINHRGSDRDAISPVDRILNGGGPSVNHAKAA
jgi:hypothetical protein